MQHQPMPDFSVDVDPMDPDSPGPPMICVRCGDKAPDPDEECPVEGF